MHQVIVEGTPRSFGARTVARSRWGCGFTREIGLMQVSRLSAGGFVAHHKDTRAGRDTAVRVAHLSELSGFFGFCPRAVSMYQELGIPIRQVA